MTDLTNYRSIPTVQPPTVGMDRRNDLFLTSSGEIMKRVQIKTPMGSVDAVVRPKDWELDELTEDCPTFDNPELLEQSLPRIPWDDADGGVIQCWSYFAHVYAAQSSEAFVWWHWDVELGKYLMIVPAYYYASGGGLNYPPHANRFCRTCRVALYSGASSCPHCATQGDIQDLLILGTSHSHGSMGPFHSAGDHSNELDVTGFHLTFGFIQRGPVINMAGSYVIAAGHTRFDTSWGDHFEYASTEESEARLGLWLTLVGRHDSSAYEVLNGDQKIAFAGAKEQCEQWLLSIDEETRATLTLKPSGISRPSAPIRSNLTMDAGRRGSSIRRQRQDEVRTVDTSDLKGKPAIDGIAFIDLLRRVPIAWRILCYLGVLDSIYCAIGFDLCTVDMSYTDGYPFLRQNEDLSLLIDVVSVKDAPESWGDVFNSWLDERFGLNADRFGYGAQAIGQLIEELTHAGDELEVPVGEDTWNQICGDLLRIHEENS